MRNVTALSAWSRFVSQQERNYQFAPVTSCSLPSPQPACVWRSKQRICFAFCYPYLALAISGAASVTSMRPTCKTIRTVIGRRVFAYFSLLAAWIAFIRIYVLVNRFSLSLIPSFIFLSSSLPLIWTVSLHLSFLTFPYLVSFLCSLAYSIFPSHWSRYSDGLRTGRTWNGGSIIRRDKRFFSSSQRPKPALRPNHFHIQ
jgi:hypothetical protein